MTPIRPPALKPDALLGIVSPASHAKPERVHAGTDTLHRLGYRTRLYPHALDKGPLYYAGTVEARVADLHAAFADPAIDAVLCTRGGWGSAELLPHLDAALIRANPKPFLGYSDHTSLHVWLARETGLVTFYAPMVAADFARHTPDNPVGVDLPSWHHALTEVPPGASNKGWSLSKDAGLRTLRSGLTNEPAEGTLLGGCLSIFVEALGTPYAMPPATPDASRILFLEDIGTKPYQWDRMLLHLRYAGLLDHVTGIVFGDMSQNVTPEEMPLLEAALLHALHDFPGPIAIGLRSGHVDTPNITLPLNIRTRLDLTHPTNPHLHFLEAAVIA